RKCSYCDFCTIQFDRKSVEAYHDSLKKEIEMYEVPGIVDTLYFGGGSPSLYPIDLMEEIVSHINLSLGTDVSEATIEANPWELDKEHLLAWRSIGFTRLSVGVQSSERSILERCDRRVPADLMGRLFLSRDTFDNLNLDFILGLPGENRENVIANLELIKELSPDHVSYYIFDSDHETELMRRVHDAIIELPDSEAIAELHDMVLESLASMGYKRYEISSWAKDGSECLHNLKYWRNEEYLGFGVSAGGHLDRKRYINTEDLQLYSSLVNQKIKPIAEFAENDAVQELFETLFMGLRLAEGVDLSDLVYSRELLSLLISKIKTRLGDYISSDEETLKLNDSGMDVSRRVLQQLLDIKEEIEIAFST
ncbi:MAG TPA: coproporphyrinogen-III oxidase family protein, partial [Mesotoga sp.]|nr:coproporphyrinogen-III oxidase family protein [Mesotoga sp.]